MLEYRPHCYDVVEYQRNQTSYEPPSLKGFKILQDISSSNAPKELTGVQKFRWQLEVFASIDDGVYDQSDTHQRISWAL